MIVRNHTLWQLIIQDETMFNLLKFNGKVFITYTTYFLEINLIKRVATQFNEEKRKPQKPVKELINVALNMKLSGRIWCKRTMDDRDSYLQL